MYDPTIGRFPSIDPIADQFAFVSPFNYAENEPIGHIDLWGLQQVGFESPSDLAKSGKGIFHDNGAQLPEDKGAKEYEKFKKKSDEAGYDSEYGNGGIFGRVTDPNPALTEQLLAAAEVIRFIFGNVVLLQQGTGSSTLRNPRGFSPTFNPRDLSKIDNIIVTPNAIKPTVWDDIIATQSVYPGSVLPKSFELTTSNGSRVWVHGNATEHIAEFLKKNADSLTPESLRLSTQLHLKGLQSAVNTATKGGIKYDELIKVGNWDLKFSPPRAGFELPVLKHAQFYH